MVLVVPLPISKNWIARKFDAKPWLSSAISLLLAALVNEAAEVSALLLWMHRVFVCIFSLCLIVYESNLQTVWEFHKHPVSVSQLLIGEILVHLHGDQAGKAVARVPNAGVRQAAWMLDGVCLKLVMGLQSWMVETHAGDCAPQGLHVHTAPETKLAPLCFRGVIFPLSSGLSWPVAPPGMLSCAEGPKFIIPTVLQEVNKCAISFQVIIKFFEQVSLVHDN